MSSLPTRMPDGPIFNAHVNEFFARTPTLTYPLDRAFRLTEAAIKSRLDRETPKAVGPSDPDRILPVGAGYSVFVGGGLASPPTVICRFGYKCIHGGKLGWNHDFALANGGVSVTGCGAVPCGVITWSKQTSMGCRLGARKNVTMPFQFETLTYRSIEYPLMQKALLLHSKHSRFYGCASRCWCRRSPCSWPYLVAGVILAALCWWAATHYGASV